MTDYSTTTVDLLQNAQRAVKKQNRRSGTLPSLHQVKVGPVRNPIAYPFIAIVPVEERPVEIWNGILNNVRRIRVEAFSHKADSKSAMRASTGIIEKVKDIFEVNSDDWQIPNEDGNPTVYDTNIVGINPGSRPSPYRNGFISMASIELDCFSKDPLHPDVGGTTYAELLESDTKTLVDTVTNVYRSYRMGVEDVLSSAKSFKSFTLPPQMKYPVLFIGIENHDREHRYAGRDLVSRLIAVYILSKMIDREEALLQNVKLADYCRQIMFANKNFQGRAMHFNYRGIVHGQVTSGAELLYGSVLQFDIQSIDSVT